MPGHIKYKKIYYYSVSNIIDDYQKNTTKIHVGTHRNTHLLKWTYDLTSVTKVSYIIMSELIHIQYISS